MPDGHETIESKKLTEEQKRQMKIDFARTVAEAIILKYPSLGDRLDIAMLIRSILELDSFAANPQ